MKYKTYRTMYGKDAVIKTNDDGSTSSFILGVDNPEEQAYLAWLAEGNEVLPAENT